VKNGEGNVWVVVVVVDVRKKKRMAARSKPTASSLSSLNLHQPRLAPVQIPMLAESDFPRYQNVIRALI
jgi:hypothetical protein